MNFHDVIFLMCAWCGLSLSFSAAVLWVAATRVSARVERGE